MTADQLEQAARGLQISARLEGPNHLVLLDVAVPADAPEGLRPAMRAACALHRRIQAEDVVADVEETLEDALKADDASLIDEGCEMYRALLASRLKSVLDGPDGPERLRDLAASA